MGVYIKILLVVFLISVSWHLGGENKRHKLFSNSTCFEVGELGRDLLLGIQRKTVCEVRQWRVIFKNGYIYVDDKRPRVDVNTLKSKQDNK